MNEPWRCGWCPPPRMVGRKPSQWEQQTLRGEWLRMCTRCARRKLNNPFNALLPMRKVGEQ